MDQRPLRLALLLTALSLSSPAVGAGATKLDESHLRGPQLESGALAFRAMAFDGDHALAGQTRDDDAGLDAGAVYLFERDVNGWQQVKKLLPSAPGFDTELGHALAIDGDTVIVGATGDDGVEANEGAAYVFGRDEGGLDNWGEVKKIRGPELRLTRRMGAVKTVLDSIRRREARADVR